MSRKKNRRGRPINGILLLDKPTAITSNAVLQQVKRIFFAEKAGHTGALDPLATGMLPICFGEATKFSQYLLDSDKRYRVIAKLGQRTNTSDADGEVVQTRDIIVNLAQLEQTIDKFRGVIDQIPSMYSALKYQGKPLYEYARAGIDIPREPRQIRVHEIKLLRFEGDEVEMEIHCSKGTYIRTIVDDLGEMLGCGAHVLKLHRSQVASYPADKLVTLEQLELTLEKARQMEVVPSKLLDEFLVPIETSVSGLAKLSIEPELLGPLKQGQAVQVLGSIHHVLVRLHCAQSDHFLGVGILNDEGTLFPKRIIIN